MYRVSRKGGDIDDADTIDGARHIVRCQPLGRYDWQTPDSGIAREPA
jgi:hypothetical protein